MKHGMNLATALTIVVLFAAGSVQSQSFFSRVVSKRNGKKKNTPTIITSDMMDFDISKNVAVFTGNVQVDDANMRIFCHKMIITFEGGKEGLKEISNTATDNGKTPGKKKEGGAKVKTITCLKNVIIIRKLYDEKDKKGGEQKAVADKAVYDVKAGSITLSENPSLLRGRDVLRGDLIIYWVDSERVSVRSSRRHTSTLKINADSMKKEEETDE